MIKAHSGKFVLRLPPPLHRQLALEAQRSHRSLNKICLNLLTDGLQKEGAGGSQALERGRAVIPILKRRFGSDLLAVLLFGSQVAGEATASSDIDLLVVLSDKIDLDRSLYRWWDEEVPTFPEPILNPQFVHLPSSPEEAGGLWLEVALAHEILWEKGQMISKILEALKKGIAGGQARRYWSNGQPYWVKE